MSAKAAPGPIVLLLHGLRSTPDELLTLNNALKTSGIATHNLRIPGYSYAVQDEEPVAPAFANWVQCVQTQVMQLRQQHSHVILAGISAGATLALGTALRLGTSLDGVVLLSTTLWYDGWNTPFYRWLFPLALYTPLGALWSYKEQPPYGVKNPRIREWIAKELKTRKISSAGAATIQTHYLREFDRLIRQVKKTLSTGPCPAGLAIHAREDDVASLSNLEFLQKHWSSGHLEAVILENSYHMITLDNERQRVAAEVIAFVKRVANVPPPSPAHTAESLSV